MAKCLAQSIDSGLSVTDTSIKDCVGYALLEPTEYLQAFQYNSFTVGDISSLLFLGSGLILIGYLSSYPVGIIIKFINRL